MRWFWPWIKDPAEPASKRNLGLTYLGPGEKVPEFGKQRDTGDYSADYIKAAVRRYPYLRRILNVHSNMVLGPNGILPVFTSNNAQRAFEKWVVDPVHGRSWSEYQRYMSRQLWMYGNVFLLEHDDGFRVLPFASWNREMTEKTRDAIGRIRRYIFNVKGGGTVAYDAEVVLHWFINDDFTPGIGQSIISPAIDPLKSLSIFDSVIMDASLEASKIGLLFKISAELEMQLMGDPDDPDTQKLADQLKEQLRHLLELKPGERSIVPDGLEPLPVEAGGLDFQSRAYSPFRKGAIGEAGTAADLSYNTLAGDYEAVNYSSLRQAYLTEQQTWRYYQGRVVGLSAMLIHRFAQVAAPTRVVVEKWRIPGFHQIDPTKEMNADILAVNNFLTSKSAVIEKHGELPEEVFQQIADDNKLLADLGITGQQTQQSKEPG